MYVYLISKIITVFMIAFSTTKCLYSNTPLISSADKCGGVPCNNIKERASEHASVLSGRKSEHTFRNRAGKRKRVLLRDQVSCRSQTSFSFSYFRCISVRSCMTRDKK